jgi:hypothetical protein
MNITNTVMALALPVSAIGIGSVIGEATNNSTAKTVAKGAGVVSVAGGMSLGLLSSTPGRSLAGIMAAGIGAGLLLGTSD